MKKAYPVARKSRMWARHLRRYGKRRANKSTRASAKPGAKGVSNQGHKTNQMTFEELLSHKDFLFLSKIADEGNYELRAVIHGAHRTIQRNLIGKHVDEISKLPIEYTKAPYYELTWRQYFSFMVRDEHTAAVRKDQEYVGSGSVKCFKKSWLLAAVPELSNGTHKLNGKQLKHFGLYCHIHIVDVLAYDEPSVRDLGLCAVKPKTAPLESGMSGA